MRMMKRNQRKLFYSAYGEGEPVLTTDRYGNEYWTEGTPGYSTPTVLYANISAAKGESSQQAFGEVLEYDRVIAVSGKAPFTEQARLWVDNLTGGSVPADTPHDYVVARIAESLNFTLIAIRRVTVSLMRAAITPPEPEPFEGDAYWTDGTPLCWTDGEAAYLIEGYRLVDSNGYSLVDSDGYALVAGG